MRHVLVAAAAACASDPDRIGKDRGVDPPSTSLPEPTTPIDIDCDPELDPVDATGLAVAEMPENPLARTLTVELEAPAGAIVTCALVASPTRLVEVLPTDATWRYLDDGSAAPAGYEEPGFDDASWKTAPAPFHREQVGTTVLGEAAAPPVAYFRTTFEVDDLSVVAALRTAIRHDDGVVVWLNGVEAFRDNVPAEERVTGNDELELVPREIDASLLVEGTNTLAAEVHQADDSTDASFGFRVALELADLLPETLVLGTEETAEEHVFPLYGLLPEATYECVARSNACDGASVPATIRTDALDLTVPPLALRLGAETPGAGAYTLFNHQRPCADEHSNRLFVVDPEGRVRWYEELPIDAPSSIDIEAVWQPDDGTFLWGGGDQVGIPPQEVALDGTVPWVASYPGIEQEEYHHDIEVLPNGRILGLIDSSVTDGADDWAGIGLVEHDPATGEVTWRWTADEAWANGELSPVEPGEGDPWHPNSLAYVSDEDGEGIYVSLLYSNEIIRIDRTTGHVLYSLGVEGDFVLTEGTWFDHLHAIDVGPDGRLFVHACGSGMNMSPQRIVTASKLPSGTSSSSPSTQRSSRFVSPRARAFSRAKASIGSTKSVPRTWPPGPARSAAESAGSPVPDAMSSTRWPGAMRASSRMRELTGAVERVSISSHLAQPGATFVQLPCSLFFSSAGSAMGRQATTGGGYRVADGSSSARSAAGTAGSSSLISRGSGSMRSGASWERCW